MAVKITATGFEAAGANIASILKKSIQKNVPPIVIDYLKNLLKSNTQAVGGSQPTKKDSTKRRYDYAPFGDKNNWLVRTGLSTKLSQRNLTNGVEILVDDVDDVLKYHTPKASTQGNASAVWMELNTKAQQDVIDEIAEQLRKSLK